MASKKWLEWDFKMDSLQWVRQVTTWAFTIMWERSSKICYKCRAEICLMKERLEWTDTICFCLAANIQIFPRRQSNWWCHWCKCECFERQAGCIDQIMSFNLSLQMQHIGFGTDETPDYSKVWNNGIVWGSIILWSTRFCDLDEQMSWHLFHSVLDVTHFSMIYGENIETERTWRFFCLISLMLIFLKCHI
jgi:hypothetical protein